MCHANKDGCQCTKRSALPLTVGYLESATIPETSEKPDETVYTICAWLGRCSKFDIATTKWRQCEQEDERSYGSSLEEAGHSPSSILVARH